ncbi:hypothetical protein [Ornithinimicrobium sp. W1665]|uniref:hypothetical protein n=1 Tax=Ornithinimicrobium sp. W1665 TaxID=3416666 RepID=UPI003CF2E8F6
MFCDRFDCHNEIPEGSRVDRVFCSDRCRYLVNRRKQMAGMALLHHASDALMRGDVRAYDDYTAQANAILGPPKPLSPAMLEIIAEIMAE